MTKIKNVRIKQTSSGSGVDYQVIVDIEDNGNQVDEAKVVFNTPFGENPVPSPTTVTCTYNSTEPNGTKLFKSTLGVPTFSGDALGFIYSTTSTMYDDRKEPLGDTFDKEVTVTTGEEV